MTAIDQPATTSSRLSEVTRRLTAEPGSHVDGRWISGSSERAISVVDPASEELLAEVPVAGAETVSAAIGAARRHFDSGAWPRMSPRERSAALHRLADVVERDRLAFVELGVAEVGSPLPLSRTLHGETPVRVLRYWGDLALRGPRGGWELGLGIHDAPVASASILVREPAGVVAAITAYNYPLMLTAVKVGAALATGCTVVLMPSPRAVLAAVAFMRCCEAAELPAGAVNLVIGEAAAGAQLCESLDVDVVSFTGSREVGSAIMAQCAPSVKKVILELGGKSPNILLPGADVDAAVQPSILRFCRNAGQGCGCTTRTLVPRAEYEHYVDAARRVFEGMRVGDPWEETTDIGPLISAAQRDRVEAYVDRATSSGAVIEAGGGRPAGLSRGHFMNGALVGHVDNSMEICREELFGPVGALLPYDDVDDAVAIANDSIYGLNANVWGRPDEAIRVARRLRTGTVSINGGGGERADVPWSGYRLSGVGAERGEEGFIEFLQTKHIQWPLTGPGTAAGGR